MAWNIVPVLSSDGSYCIRYFLVSPLGTGWLADHSAARNSIGGNDQAYVETSAPCIDTDGEDQHFALCKRQVPACIRTNRPVLVVLSIPACDPSHRL